MKKNKGFTLIEVVVVAIIIMCLAAVAIPQYNAYVKKNRPKVEPVDPYGVTDGEY